MDYERYYNRLAKDTLWGSLREIVLSENICRYISKKNRNVIDIGCGDGFLLHCLTKRLKCDFWGLDISAVRIKRLKNRLPFIRTVKGDILKLPFENNQFDAVICSEVLEHVPNFEKAINELIRITKKELIITVPNDQGLKKVICPRCEKEHYVDGHMNKFNVKTFKELIRLYSDIKIQRVRKFYTIYSYNRLTFKLPVCLRLLLDQCIVRLERYISFFKPNYLLIKIEKK